jgi:hypothetical protein
MVIKKYPTYQEEAICGAKKFEKGYLGTVCHNNSSM